MATKQVGHSAVVLGLLALIGWGLAFGLWFKSDYAWAQMREKGQELEVSDAFLKKAQADRHDAQAYAWKIQREYYRCKGIDASAYERVMRKWYEQ